MPDHTTRQSSEVKTCSKCKQEKPLSEFPRRRDSPDGYRNDCKACKSRGASAYRAANLEREMARGRAWREANKERKAETDRAWYEANRERAARLGRAWREANRERYAEMLRAWYEANRERAAEQNRAWRKANPEKKAEYGARERAKYPDRVAARRAVRAAVMRGDFPPASALVCDHCQEAQAEQWHHHLGYEPEHALDVIPVCIPCHTELDRGATP